MLTIDLGPDRKIEAKNARDALSQLLFRFQDSVKIPGVREQLSDLMVNVFVQCGWSPAVEAVGESDGQYPGIITVYYKDGKETAFHVPDVNTARDLIHQGMMAPYEARDLKIVPIKILTDNPEVRMAAAIDTQEVKGYIIRAKEIPNAETSEGGPDGTGGGADLLAQAGQPGGDNQLPELPQQGDGQDQDPQRHEPANSGAESGV